MSHRVIDEATKNGLQPKKSDGIKSVSSTNQGLLIVMEEINKLRVR